MKREINLVKRRVVIIVQEECSANIILLKLVKGLVLRISGKSKSEETCRRMSISMLGKHPSEATKAKMSERMRGDNNPSKRPEVKAKKSGDKNPSKRLEVKAKISAKRIGMISVFDLHSQKGVCITTEEYRANRNRYCMFNSHQYQDFFQQQPAALEVA